jgi:thiol-disulfide isomerase/thioredoxin
MNSAGELLWRLESPDPVLAVEPRFVVADGSVRIDHNPLNLALTLGEDGQLYRLRARDTSGQEAVLDIVSPEDGRIVRSIPVGSARLTLALGPAGRLHLLDDATLLGAVAPGDRESLPAFDWPSRQGERVTSADLPGRVALINVWASWCTPCRREMPALDSLQQVLRGETFQFIALNADAQRADADAYLAQFPFTFPVVYGGTQTASVFRYPGLPYTLLVDADGRIMRRWAGQLMRRDMEQIHALVRAEQLRIAASTVVTDGNEHAGHRPE